MNSNPNTLPKFTSSRITDNPKNNILMSENIRQRRITILEYIHALIA